MELCFWIQSNEMVEWFKTKSDEYDYVNENARKHNADFLLRQYEMNDELNSLRKEQEFNLIFL